MSCAGVANIELLYPDIDRLRYVSPLNLYQVKTKSETLKSIKR